MHRSKGFKHTLSTKVLDDFNVGLQYPGTLSLLQVGTDVAVMAKKAHPASKVRRACIVN